MRDVVLLTEYRCGAVHIEDAVSSAFLAVTGSRGPEFQPVSPVEGVHTGPRRRIDHELVLDDLRHGLSVADVALRAACSEDSVRRIRQKYGL